MKVLYNTRTESILMINTEYYIIVQYFVNPKIIKISSKRQALIILINISIKEYFKIFLLYYFKLITKRKV